MGGKWPAKEYDGYVAPKRYPAGSAKAWLPFAILSVFVLLWGLPSIKLAMNQATTPAFKVVLAGRQTVRPGPAGWDWPYLHTKFRAHARCRQAYPRSGALRFQLADRHGHGLLPRGASLRPAPWDEARIALMKIFWRTLVRMRLAMIAISCMLGLGFVTRYSGMDAVLGLAFTRTGWLFPFFGTFIGWLGVALTGSDTSSNALFGSLQKITAQQLDRAHPDDRHEQRRRRDGQNDRRAIHHHRHRRHRTSRQRRQHLPLCVLAFGRARLSSASS